LNFKNSGELNLCHDLDVQHLQSLHKVEPERGRGREAGGRRGLPHLCSEQEEELWLRTPSLLEDPHTWPSVGLFESVPQCLPPVRREEHLMGGKVGQVRIP
jgi:hypothetical protein